MQLDPERKKRFDDVVRRYPVKRSVILPLLHLLQDQEGWLSTEALEYAASLLELTPAQVHDAATYYTMFRFKPEGKHQLEFCTNLSCALYGADELVAEACRRLGVEETEAFRRLRRLSSDCNWKVIEIARQVLQAEEVFELLDRMGGPR